MVNLLTQEQVRQLAVEAGFPKKAARILSAIAMCEAPTTNEAGEACSDFDKIGDIDLSNEKWEYSRSGYQIRCLWSHAGTGDIRDPERMHRPRFATRSALEIWRNADGFTPWSTFKDGQYKAYLQDLFPPEPGTYIVVAGDTLTGIALKVGVAWDELARINNLHSPYTLYIGQVLQLS